MAVFISRAFEFKNKANVTFKDLKKTASSYEAVSKLYAAGITTGYPDQTFKPNPKISRGHTALFLARA